MKKNCIDCIFWHSTRLESYQGYCIISIDCINLPKRPRFVNKYEVVQRELAEQKKSISEIKSSHDIGIKGKIAFIDTESASITRRQQSVVYPDMRQLTDKSKEELRKLRRRKNVPKTA